jgi:hypothetical protein
LFKDPSVGGKPGPAGGKLTRDEQKVYDLVSLLDSSTTSKVAAIKAFEKYFFDTKPS